MNYVSGSGFLDRTLRNLRAAWRSISGSEYSAEVAARHPELPDGDVADLRKQMQTCLMAPGGEVSARARAAALGQAYLALNPEGRRRFLRVLAEDFDTDHDAVNLAIKAVGQARDPEARLRAERDLRQCLIAPRVKLLTQFNALPQGVKFLIDLRAELLPSVHDDPVLHGLDADLRNLLATWFDVDFLELKQITWEKSPAALLEKLIAYEAVHEIQSWDDLKNRLEPDRRCFAYFHPRMPDEPLIFVQVALVNGLADNVQVLLDRDTPQADPGQADTAIFYSITNAQQGLVGISFGNFLIKRVVDRLAREFRGLKIFATLSPIPGFRAWFDETMAANDPQILTADENAALQVAASESGREDGGEALLKSVLADDAWVDNESLKIALKPILLRQGARYLAQAKRRSGTARDSVAHFHLSNGARIDRINWMGDSSPKGIAQSAGMMVNYVYDLDDIENNHEAYTTNGNVAVSNAVRGLLKA
ncbi:MAG: malonyl-CoA decarboxylase [Rhodospirillales bacterium]